MEAQLPLRIVATSIVFRRLDQTAFVPDYVNIHHRDETIIGVGDAWLLGRFAFGDDQLRGVVRAGLTVPLGSTVPDPFALADQGKEHQHAQIGTGVVQPIVGLAGFKSVGGWRVRGHVMAILGLYPNTDSYQPGHRGLIGAAGDTALGPARISMGADVSQETPETWGGANHHEGNLGRTDVLLNVGVNWPLGDRWRGGLTIRVPVVQRVNEDAVTYPAILEFRVDGDIGN